MDVQSNILVLEEELVKPVPALLLPIDRREACNWQGRHGLGPIAVVEHIGVAPTFDSLVNYLFSCNAPQVSATFVIGGDYVGQWALLVGSGPDARYASGKKPLAFEQLLRAANHAGIESRPNSNPHPEYGNPNWWTWGKEHVGYPGQVWTETMIQNDIDCNTYIRTVVGNGAFQYVLGHMNFDPINRANCPGPTFPWARIYGRAFFLEEEDAVLAKSIPLDRLQKLPIGDWEAYNKLLKEYHA